MQSTPREFLYFLGHLHIGQLLIALLAVQMDRMLVFILRFQPEPNCPATILLLQMLQNVGGTYCVLAVVDEVI